MGSQQSEFDSASWVPSLIGPSYNLIKNKFTGQVIRQYDKQFVDQVHFDEAKKIYNKRAEASPVTVQTLGVQNTKSKLAICSQSVMAKVYTQHTQLSLKDIGAVRPEVGAGILQNSLKGFGEVVKISGKHFPVTDELIAFQNADKLNCPKVWLNQDYAENLPLQDYVRSGAAEEQMTLSVIKAVQKHFEGQQLPPNLLSALKQVSPLTLEGAQTALAAARAVPGKQKKFDAGKQLSFNLYKGPGSKQI